MTATQKKSEEKQEVKIYIEGGVIHDTEIPKGITVIVIDSDTEGVHDNDLTIHDGKKVFIDRYESTEE